MPRYIDAEKVKEAFWADLEHLSCYDADLVDLMIIELDETPAADVVEVVRCKDCKYSIPSFCGITAGTHLLCRRKDEYWKPNDFCSYGEQRDGDRE